MHTATQIKGQQVQDEAHWEEPADYDSWYSALVSFVFHFCVVMLVPLLATVLAPAENVPPAIEVVQVVDTNNASGRMNDDVPAAMGAESSTEQTEIDQLLNETPQEAIEQITEVTSAADTLTNEDILAETASAVSQSKQAAAAARAAAAKQLAGNLGGGSQGTGGSGGGRAGRAARWILNFESSNTPHYLRQLGGLGAEIAFPSNGGKYLYFTNLDGTPTSHEKDLANENRIFWFNDDPDSINRLAQHLGIRPTNTMVAFLPQSLENEMVKMELAYQNATSEDDIAQTVFVCISSGNRYTVQVLSQVLR